MFPVSFTTTSSFPMPPPPSVDGQQVWWQGVPTYPLVQTHQSTQQPQITPSDPYLAHFYPPIFFPRNIQEFLPPATITAQYALPARTPHFQAFYDSVMGSVAESAPAEPARPAEVTFKRPPPPKLSALSIGHHARSKADPTLSAEEAFRRFKCEYCGKGFTQNEDLRRHVRIHTGERPYACDECGRRFIQNGHLTDHKKRHQTSREYVCTVGGCTSSFVGMKELNAHVQTHLTPKGSKKKQ